MCYISYMVSIGYTSSPDTVGGAKAVPGESGQQDVSACGAMSCFPDEPAKARFARLPAAGPQVRQKPLQAGPPLNHSCELKTPFVPVRMPTTIDPIGRREITGVLHLIPNGW